MIAKTPEEAEGRVPVGIDAEGNVHFSEKVAEHGPHKLYRCNIKGCERVYLHEDVRNGGCPHCKGRRCGFATALTDDEAAYVRSRGFDLEANGWGHDE